MNLEVVSFLVASFVLRLGGISKLQGPRVDVKASEFSGEGRRHELIILPRQSGGVPSATQQGDSHSVHTTRNNPTPHGFTAPIRVISISLTENIRKTVIRINSCRPESIRLA